MKLSNAQLMDVADDIKYICYYSAMTKSESEQVDMLIDILREALRET